MLSFVDKGGNQRGVFDPTSAFHARRNIRSGRLGLSQGLHNILGAQTTGNQPTATSCKFAHRSVVPALAAARYGRIDEQEIFSPVAKLGSFCVHAYGTDSVETGSLDCLNIFWGALAMQLDPPDPSF